MKLFLIVVYVTVAFNTKAQNLNMKISKSVGLVTFSDSISSDFGTGTLIAKWSDSFHFKVYLVTNKHVLPQSKQSRTITFKIRNNDLNPNTFLSFEIPIYSNSNKLLPTVRFAKNDEDVAIVEFPGYSQLRFLDNLLIPYQLLATKDILSKNGLSIGTPVFFLGYPGLFFDKRNISPILRRGFVATDPTNNYFFSDELRASYYEKYKAFIPERLNGFLMDASVFGGSSGSLVFSDPSNVSDDGNILSLGFRVNYIIEITTFSYSDLNTSSVQKINVGGVISAEVIKETLDLFP